MSDIAIGAGVASRLIAEYGITKPGEIDLDAICLLKGAFVREAVLTGAAGRLLRRGDHAVITIDSSIREPGQKRFTVAHELGHLLLHQKLSQLAACTDEQFLAWYRGSSVESEANNFAAELLLPADIFRNQCPVTLDVDLVRALSEAFHTTLTATVIRLVEVGPYICALVVSVNGEMKWFRTSNEFRFRLLPSGTRIDGDSCAADFFNRGRAEPVSDDVPARCWVGDQRIESHHVLKELAIPLPRYKTVLSLLWVQPRSALDRMDDEDGQF